VFKVNEELRTLPHISKSSSAPLVGSPDCLFDSDVLRREGVNVTALLNKKNLGLTQSSALLHPTHLPAKNLFLLYCIFNKKI